MYLNEIKLIGFVGQDAELKSSQNSKELVRFDVATKASWKNRDSGEYDSRTEWHRIVVWSNLTKFAQTLKKASTSTSPVSCVIATTRMQSARAERPSRCPLPRSTPPKSGASIREPQKMVRLSRRRQCFIRQGGPQRPA